MTEELLKHVFKKCRLIFLNKATSLKETCAAFACKEKQSTSFQRVDIAIDIV